MGNSSLKRTEQENVSIYRKMAVAEPTFLINNGRSRMWAVREYGPDYFQLASALPLETKPPIMFMGQVKHQQRDVGFFSDTSEGYRYSGVLMRSKPISPNPSTGDSGQLFLAWLLPAVNQSLGTDFNGVLVNRYNSGEDYISAHSDDESALDCGTVESTRKAVASISYGATRKFRIRDKQTNAIVLDYPVESRTLLVMDGNFQTEFKHEVVRELRVREPRISCTFRCHLR
jgi:alkylated DNA repair dioxygenase AlkB